MKTNSNSLSPPAAILAGWGRELTVNIQPHRLIDSNTNTNSGGDLFSSSSSSSSPVMPLPTTEPFWMSTGVWIHELIDSSLYPPEYEYTITGNRRRKPRKGIIQPSQNIEGTSTTPPMNTLKLGKNIEINKRNITLFRYKDYIYAIDTYCPHNGANLDMGDIEDYQYLPSSSSCLPSSQPPTSAKNYSTTTTTTTTALTTTSLSSLPPGPILTSVPPSLLPDLPNNSTGVIQSTTYSKPPRPTPFSSIQQYIPSSTVGARNYPSLCVVCPRHGFVFNLTSGTSILPPGTFSLGQYTTRIYVPSISSGSPSLSSDVPSSFSQVPTGMVDNNSSTSTTTSGISGRSYTTNPHSPIDSLVDLSKPLSVSVDTTKDLQHFLSIPPNHHQDSTFNSSQSLHSTLSTDNDTLIDTLSKIVYSEQIPRQDIRDMLYPSLSTNPALRPSDISTSPSIEENDGNEGKYTNTTSNTTSNAQFSSSSSSRRSSIPLPHLNALTAHITPTSTGPSTARTSQTSSPHRSYPPHHHPSSNIKVPPSTDRRRSIQELLEHIVINNNDIQKQKHTVQFPGDGIIEIAMPYLDKKLFSTDLDF